MLAKKSQVWAPGWTWGYRMVIDGFQSSGSSIGEDEIKIFYDLPNLIDANAAYCIGVAFGLSSFALALAKPDIAVYDIDNYSERSGYQTDIARKFVETTIQNRVRNVKLYIGTSPEDTPNCLADLPQGSANLALHLFNHDFGKDRFDMAIINLVPVEEYPGTGYLGYTDRCI